MTIRSATILFLWFMATSLHAEQFNPPGQIVHSGKTYNLVYKDAKSNGEAIFEYTTNNEPIEKWSTLVTINYAKNLATIPLKWIESVKSALDMQTPKPSYSLYLKENSGYARIIYEPNASYTNYESNVQKSFHIDKCGGVVVYQFAQKYPQSADQSNEGKLSTLKNIARENKIFADEMEKSDWLPGCNTAMSIQSK